MYAWLGGGGEGVGEGARTVTVSIKNYDSAARKIPKMMRL